MRRIVSFLFLFFGFLSLLFGIHLSTKFKNTESELGIAINSDKFVSYGSRSDVNIDLSKVNINQVGRYNVPLKYMFVEYDLTVDVVDKTPPKLEVASVSKPLNYVPVASDFIVDVSDYSKYSVSINNKIDTSKIGEYDVEIMAQDIYQNVQKKQAKLYIGWIKGEYEIEVGNEIKIENLVHDIEDADTVSQSDLDVINQNDEGIYYLESKKNDLVQKVKIVKTRDVTPPELILQELTIYDGKTVNSVDDFVKSVTDNGGKVSLKILSEIDYQKIGEQKITIEAIDEKGNSITKETTLTIIEDNIGPKISGLTTLTVDKGTVINYKKGVSSLDENTGNCDYIVDSKSVDTSKAGTYQATYISSDSLGNKTTSKRVIIVNHDKNDTDELLKKAASALPTDAEKIRDYVRNTIKYNTNWGGDDPIWYGLKNKVGNCFVHATILDALLKLKGFETKLIWTTEKTHYWNMIYLNGKWYHMDSTPRPLHTKYSLMNDKQRLEGLSKRVWDKTLWPEAG